MKSERRHELQHNALLDWLIQTGEAIKPHLNAILLGVLVVVLGIVGYQWYSSTMAVSEATAWDSVFQAMDEQDTVQLTQTAKNFQGSNAAQWAAVIAGDMQLAAGCGDVFTTKEAASDQLTRARDNYLEALKDSRSDELRARATYGLARAYEAMAATGQSPEGLDSAKKQYTKILENWKNCPYAEDAQRRLTALEQTSTKEFYDALAKWEPNPPMASPAGLDNLNLPFDDAGTGLDVGKKPASFFNEPGAGMVPPAADGADESTGAAGAEPEVEAPAMPAPAEDKPAEPAEEDSK